MSKIITNLSTLQIHKASYENILNHLNEIPNNSFILTTDKNIPIPTKSDYGKCLYIDINGNYTFKKPTRSQSYSYASLNVFLDSIIYTQYDTHAVLDGIYVDSTFVPVSDLSIGADFYLHELEVPDYWLASTYVEGTISSGLSFFQEQEAVPVGLGVMSITGAELEKGLYKDGQLYYCTSASELFKAGCMYYGSIGGVMEIYSTPVSLTPGITAFKAITGTYEIGSSFTSIPYMFELKRAIMFESLVITYKGMDIYTVPDTSVTSGTINYSIVNNTLGTTELILKGILSTGNVVSAKSSYTVVPRQYFGTSTLEVLTDEDATNLFGNVTQARPDMYTCLSSTLPKTVTISAGDTPTYIYIVTPHTIDSITSNNFNFPYTQVSDITITNSYGVDVIYKCYRSYNLVYGDMTLNF